MTAQHWLILIGVGLGFAVALVFWLVWRRKRSAARAHQEQWDAEVLAEAQRKLHIRTLQDQFDDV